MKSPITWYGGKYYMAKHIIELLPKHDCYVEAYGGAGSVLFAKNPSKVEFLNDIHKDLYNMFNIIKDNSMCSEFERRVNLMLYSKNCYDYALEYLKQDTTVTDAVERAVCFYYLARVSFSGIIGGSFAYSTIKNKSMAYYRAIERLQEVHERLKNVQIMNLEALDLIKRTDTKDTCFYLDPPYIHETREKASVKPYNHEMDNEQHQELVDTLKSINGSCVLSGYATNMYDELLDYGYLRYGFEVHCVSANAKRCNSKRKPRTEILWVKDNNKGLLL